jgi:hypothetical protein
MPAADWASVVKRKSQNHTILRPKEHFVDQHGPGVAKVEILAKSAFPE